MRQLFIVLILSLNACTSSSTDSTNGGQSSSTATAESAPKDAAISAGCSWLVVSNPDLVNVAFPDKAATYWVGAVPYIPGTRLRIDGQFPQARYFSFTAYSPLLAAVDGVVDYTLVPKVPGTNPYLARNVSAGGEYVAYVMPEPKPEQPAENTLYSGKFPITLGVSLPANPLMLLIYRIYLPEVNGSGGVPLPSLTLETADGATALLKLDMSICQPLPPNIVPGVLNQQIRESSLPDPLITLASTVPLPITQAQTEFVRNYGVPETVRETVSNAIGVNVPIEAITTSTSLNLLNNLDNAYLTALLSRDKGSLYVVRGKAPKYALHPSDAPLGSAQLRYWSFCTNEIITQRFVDCLADFEVPLDDSGYFTIVVSDASQRPVNVTTVNGMGWLPWGSIYPDSEIIYRHMLPSLNFPEAVQNIPFGAPAADVMGDYFPQITYCDRKTIEASGSNPATIFSSCLSAYSQKD